MILKEFRAKNLLGDWVYGYGVVPVYENTYKTDKMEMIKSVQYDELDNWDVNFDSVEIKPDTVGQYTEVKDDTKWEELTPEEQNKWLKHHEKRVWDGKKIFDGDVVKYTSGTFISKGIVRFYRGIFEIEDIEEDDCTEILSYVDDVKVIGNIYDNPELLEVEDEKAN